MKKIYDLETELKLIIEENVRYLKLDTANGDVTVPRVIIGPIPSENPEELVPAIGIVASSGKNTLESKQISIETSIVLYIKDTEKTYKAMYEMIENISKNILEKGTYLKEFEILPNMEWKIDCAGLYMATSILFNFIRIKTYRTDVDDWINGEEYR